MYSCALWESVLARGSKGLPWSLEAGLGRAEAQRVEGEAADAALRLRRVSRSAGRVLSLT